MSRLPLAPASCISICKGGKNSKELMMSLTQCRHSADTGFCNGELPQGEDSGTSGSRPRSSTGSRGFLWKLCSSWLLFFFFSQCFYVLFGAAAKLQVSPELCEPAGAVREIPFLPDGAGIGRCIGNPTFMFALCAGGNTSLSLNCSCSLSASENGGNGVQSVL